MVRLVLPDHDRRASWLASIAEFDGATLHGYGTFRFDDQDLADDDVFERWLARARRLRVAGEDGLVPATTWWIVEDEQPDVVVGSIDLRHELTEWLRAEGGHVGYGIRPSARGRGIATAALRACLVEAAELGIDRVLLVCDADDPASRHTILAVGGVLEDAPGTIERYWVGGAASASGPMPTA